VSRPQSAARYPRRRTLDWPNHAAVTLTLAALLVIVVVFLAALWDAVSWGDALAAMVTTIVVWLVLLIPVGYFIGRAKSAPKPTFLTCGVPGPAGSGSVCSIPVLSQVPPGHRRHPGSAHYDPTTGRSW